MILTITVFLCVNHVVSLPTNPFGKKMVGDIAFTDDFPENLPRGSCLIVRLYKHPRTDREKVLSRMIVDNPTSLNKTYELSLDNEEELRMAELAVESVVNVGWCDTKDSKEKRKNDFVSPLRNINLSVLRGKDDAAIIKGPNLSIRPGKVVLLNCQHGIKNKRFTLLFQLLAPNIIFSKCRCFLVKYTNSYS